MPTQDLVGAVSAEVRTAAPEGPSSLVGDSKEACVKRKIFAAILPAPVVLVPAMVGIGGHAAFGITPSTAGFTVTSVTVAVPEPAPGTVVPTTTAPATTAPSTAAPTTTAPTTTAPTTTAPTTTAPTTTAPATTAPATTAPATTAPVPTTTAPSPTAPTTAATQGRKPAPAAARPASRPAITDSEGSGSSPAAGTASQPVSSFATLPELQAVMVVTDGPTAPSMSYLEQLLVQSGVQVDDASVVSSSTGLTDRTLNQAVQQDLAVAKPDVIVVAAPDTATDQVNALMSSLPASQHVVWAEDPDQATVAGSRGLLSQQSALLTRWRSLTVVSPGELLSGHPDWVTGTGLTATGSQAYGVALLDLVAASYQLPIPLVASLAPADATGLVALAAAESRIGDPYVWAAAGPGTFDCSGLVMWAYAHAGVLLPHYSGSQYAETLPVAMNQLQPGDLLFPANPGEHVAMYVGNGDLIQAPYTGATVQVVPLASTGGFFVHATRVVAGGAATAPTDASIAAVQQYAHNLVDSQPGWGNAQWPYLDVLWNQESGWRGTAVNPQSGATGIPQALPADKMASAGADWRTDPYTQVNWGLAYIAGRYGTPQAAEAHELAFNWY